ncbi:hypothetical protein P0L50_004426 [Escherichia coli]|uniref:hypothetical protein n=1 Tax=Escherichia coli TaxID=562 RepID=UPI0021A2E652|nr:hypothetical protein [Escherichia coli]EKO5028165.1 hypothetical protein [Escherichia coli]
MNRQTASAARVMAPLAADPAPDASERVVGEAEKHHYRPRALTLCWLTGLSISVIVM